MTGSQSCSGRTRRRWPWVSLGSPWGFPARRSAEHPVTHRVAARSSTQVVTHPPGQATLVQRQIQVRPQANRAIRIQAATLTRLRDRLPRGRPSAEGVSSALRPEVRRSQSLPTRRRPTITSGSFFTVRSLTGRSLITIPSFSLPYKGARRARHLRRPIPLHLRKILRSRNKRRNRTISIHAQDELQVLRSSDFLLSMR